MSKRTARKILTVVTLAGTASLACADSPAKLTPPTSWRTATTSYNPMAAVLLDGQPYLVATGQAPVQMSYVEFGRYLGETQPLVGPDGRPGCGNILSKGATGCTTARASAVAKRLHRATDSAEAEIDHAIEDRATWRIKEATDAVAAAAPVAKAKK